MKPRSRLVSSFATAILLLSTLTVVLNVCMMKERPHNELKENTLSVPPPPGKGRELTTGSGRKKLSFRPLTGVGVDSQSEQQLQNPQSTKKKGRFRPLPPAVHDQAASKNIEDYKFIATPEEMAKQGTDVIVYLAQFGDHSTYGKQGITGASKLERSLDTLYTNYLNDFPCDVIVFYGQDNDPDPELFKRLQQGKPRLQFRQLKGRFWELPHGLREEDRKKWYLPAYSTGYRHMIRWHAFLIWPYLTSLGYTHVMRMDDDSYIYSRIKYNMFNYMRQHGKRYAFRQPCIDKTGEIPLRKIVLEHLRSDTSLGQKEQRQDYLKLPYLGFYNNWFIVSAILHMANASNII